MADLKQNLKSVKEGGAHVEESSQFHRKQRSLDYVDNLEKQHMQQIKDSIQATMSERRRLLQKLTEHSRALSDARSKDGTAAPGPGSSKEGEDAAAQAPDASTHSALHSAIADVRRQLQQNQQSINELVATAVQRISSTERLQLLQLLVRGKFLEVMNEEMSTELEMRRALTQAAMSQGALPPPLMNEAMSTESWYAEHRAALDFHAKMAKTEMGGSLRAPSIAQLLDQNMVSPQQATATQNLGELVRPFTNHQKGHPGKGKGKESISSGLRDAAGPSGSGSPLPTGGGGPSASGGSGALLSDIIDDDDRNSSSAASQRYDSAGGSASGSLQSSRGPTRSGRGPGKPPPAALAGLKKLPGQQRQGSRERQSPTHSQPPTPGSRPPSNSRATTVTKLKLAEPPVRIKRFKPPPRPAGTTQGGPGGGSGSQSPGQLPAIGVQRVGDQQPTAVQLASARAAAAARQGSRIQALGDAYGNPIQRGAGGPGGPRPPGPPRLPVAGAGQRPALPPGNRQRRPSAQGSSSGAAPLQQVQLQAGGQMPYREGRILPPAAPSARMAARLQQPPQQRR